MQPGYQLRAPQVDRLKVLIRVRDALHCARRAVDKVHLRTVATEGNTVRNAAALRSNRTQNLHLPTFTLKHPASDRRLYQLITKRAMSPMRRRKEEEREILCALANSSWAGGWRTTR